MTTLSCITESSRQYKQNVTKNYYQNTFPLDMNWNFLMSQTQIEEYQDPVACQDEDDGDQYLQPQLGYVPEVSAWMRWSDTGRGFKMNEP